MNIAMNWLCPRKLCVSLRWAGSGGGWLGKDKDGRSTERVIRNRKEIEVGRRGTVFVETNTAKAARGSSDLRN